MNVLVPSWIVLLVIFSCFIISGIIIGILDWSKIIAPRYRDSKSISIGVYLVFTLALTAMLSLFFIMIIHASYNAGDSSSTTQSVYIYVSESFNFSQLWNLNLYY